MKEMNECMHSCRYEYACMNEWSEVKWSEMKWHEMKWIDEWEHEQMNAWIAQMHECINEWTDNEGVMQWMHEWKTE